MIKLSLTILFLFLSTRISASAAMESEYINATAFVPQPVLLKEELFDDFNSRHWWGEAGDAPAPTVTWDYFSSTGEPFMRVRWDDADWHWWNYIRTDWIFNREDWTSYEGMRVDAYTTIDLDEQDVDSIGIKLEPRYDGDDDPFDSTIQDIPASLPPEEWTTIDWNFANNPHYEKVTGLVLTLERLCGEEAILYFQNMRLYDSDGNEYPWDRFTYPGFRWTYDFNYSDAYQWLGDHWFPRETLTHNERATQDSAASFHMQWDKSIGEGEAKAEIHNLSEDFSDYTHVRADVKITCNNAPFMFFFFNQDAEIGALTGAKRARSQNQWQQFEFRLPDEPEEFDWENIDLISFIVETEGEETDATGTVYVDNMYLLKYE